MRPRPGGDALLRVGSPSSDGAPGAGRGRSWLSWALAREAVLVAAAILAYFGIRNLTAGHPEAAFENADRIVAYEERIGVAWEDELQSLVVDHSLLVDLANWVYIWFHWPVILGAAIALYVLHRDRYRLLRNALFVSGAIGFVFFALFPVAPPRLLELGLVDTVTDRSHAYRALQPPGLTNQYAAFPSLHAGWNLLVGIVLVLAFAHLGLRLLAAAVPVAMALAVVMTANHFVLDVVAGVAVVLVGLAVAVVIERRPPPPVSTLVGNEVTGHDGAEDRAALGAAVRGRPPSG